MVGMHLKLLKLLYVFLFYFCRFHEIFWWQCVTSATYVSADVVQKHTWSTDLIHMLDVIPHVNIQLNMLSRSPHSVDLSLSNRCCLNSELCKFWRLPTLLSPWAECVCVGLKKRKRERGKSYFRSLHQCTLFPQWEGGHTPTLDWFWSSQWITLQAQ